MMRGYISNKYTLTSTNKQSPSKSNLVSSYKNNIIFIYYIDLQIYNTNLENNTEPISIKS